MKGRVLASLLLGLAACSDDTGSSGSIGTPKSTLAWTPCNVDFECASVEVPVDYAAPEGDKISIALLRAPAGNPDERVGTILVNPGGPGIPMVEQLVRQYRTLKIAFPVALDRFDVIAFDWRGIGGSNAVSCVDDAFSEQLRTVDLTLDDPSSVARVDEVRKTLVAGCRAKSNEKLLANMHTENAARDLDRIRIALGEEKLNYLGFSYGTWLGATYATLFPDRIRAFALDSAVLLESDLQAQMTKRAQAFDLGLGRFSDACAKDASCAFRGAGTAADVTTKLDALATKVRTAPNGLPAGSRSLSIVDFQYAMADGLRTGSAAKLGADLAKADAGDASALVARADVVAGRKADGHYDSTLVGLLAIGCLDQPLAPGTTVDTFRTFVRGLSPAPRSIGAAGIPFALCVDWPWKRATPPPAIDAHRAPPMLVVSGKNDPISTHAMARPFVDRLGNGSHLLVYEGEGHAAALRSACVREAITAFVLDPTKPPKALSCAPE